MNKNSTWSSIFSKEKEQEFPDGTTLTFELEPGINFSIYLSKEEKESFIEYIKTDNTKEAFEILFTATKRQR